MTFSQNVKNEILKSAKNLRGCCAESFLTAVLKSVGSLDLTFKGFAFSVQSDNHDLLGLCQKIAEKMGFPSEIESDNSGIKGQAVYDCTFYGNLGEKLGLVKKDADGAMDFCADYDALIPTDECCRRAFMQGLFVSGGSVVIPTAESDFGENTSKSKYHLELRFSDADFAKAAQRAYSEREFKSVARKNCTVLYLKDSEKIADFLVYLNAMSAKLKLENVIIGRSLRNAANRQSNCIAANIDKIGKYTRADKEDEDNDRTGWQPPIFEPTDDVTLLGDNFKPIPDLERERAAFRALFKRSTDVQDVEPITNEPGES